MATFYDATASFDANTNRHDPASLGRAPSALPDLYNPPRRRLHPMLLAGAAFMAASTLFYSAEATLPTAYRPSRFIGGYEKDVAKLRAEGELTARIGYDAKLKVIETAAVQIQEQCRAALANGNNLYQAAYARANSFAQSTADIQKQYAQARYNVVQGTVGGEINAANTMTTIGLIGSIFSPEFGERSLAAAEAARQQALQKLDDAAKSGITVTVEGWNTGLPDPATLPQPTKCEMPTALAVPQPPIGG